MMLPVVALHGFTGSSVSFRTVIGALDPAPPVVMTPALLGHDPEGVDPQVDSFEAEVDRIARLLRERAPVFHLAGYSLGGRVAIGLLVRHPALFATATLIGAQPGLPSETDRAERRAADARWCRVLSEDGVAAFVEQWEALPLFATQQKLSPESLRLQRTERLRHDARGLRRSLEILGLGAMPSYWESLHEVMVPTTCMAGDHDRKFTAIAKDMSKRLQNATVEIVADAGHNLLLERPDAVARALSRSLGGAG